jgi:aromatic ring-cleaving dioxygenase
MHDVPVGPHTGAMFQIAFAPDQYAAFIPWLMLNRAGLTVFVRPDMGADLADHTDHAIWMGEMLELDRSVLESEHD